MNKRKTQAEKINDAVELALKKERENKKSIEITGCSFSAISLDKSAINTISLIAEGLIENAKALGNLAQMLKATNIKIDSLVNISQDSETNRIYDESMGSRSLEVR